MFGSFMKDAFGAGDYQWTSVEVDVSEEAGMCINIWLTSGRAYMVECYVTLGENTDPFAE